MSQDHGGSGEKRFHGSPDRLRSPERLALLELPRVVEYCRADLKTGSVLDVGTGTGVFAEAFLAAGFDATGVDLDPTMLERARELVPGAIFLESSAEALPCDDAAHDIVFLGTLLHESDEPLAVLREARRVARRLVAILEWPYIEGSFGPPLEHRISPDTIEELARGVGFERIERVDLAHLTLYRLPR